MEPRPSRPSRATGQASTRTTRTPWTPPPTAEPQATQQRTADIYGAPPNQGGGQWYGQQPGVYAPDPSDYRQTGPITPIKPRNERGNKLLRYLLAALLLVGVIGGGAYAITRFLDRDDSSENPPVAAVTDNTATPETAATEPPADEVAPTPTTAPAEPTATAAVVEPTEPPADDQAVAPASDAEVATDGAAEDAEESGGGAQAFLPDPSVLPGDWSVTNEGERTKAEVADAVGPDGDALLTSWRWRENFYSDLNRNDAADAPEDASFINVSVHRFANAEGASEALTALSDIVVAVQGLQDVETPAIGDLARGLYGPGDGVNLYVLYVQQGNYVIRLGGSSATGDPSATVNALAEEILASQAGA
ncbi:MAG: hypothetical protein M9947_16190 [Thermomicrobiales bacterium]|nr:hypothetical protein [Thermomicrobiales bacterium]